MAELGVARYRELLNNNRVLAVHNLNEVDPNVEDWTHPDIAAQTCDNVNGAWVDAVNWFDITVDEPDIGFDINGDGDQDDTNEPIGSARIIDYIYDNDGDVGTDDNGDFDQTSDAANIVDPDGGGPMPASRPRGILTIQGRSIDAASTETSGVTQIEVTIPIGVNTNDLDTLDPGIWIHQENVANLGIIDFTTPNELIMGVLTPIPPKNLVLYANNNGCDNFNTSIIPGATITHLTNLGVRDPRDLPPLATRPPNIANYTVLDGDVTNGLNPQSQLILGKPSHKSNDDSDGIKRYYYEVNGNLNIIDGENLLSDGTAKVIVIVNGDLIIGSDSGSPTNITNTSNSAESSHLEIHVNGNVEISGDGTVNINSLIHVPGGTVDIIGNPTINLRGSIWANDWNSVGTVNVIREDSDDKSYQYYSIVPQRTPKPLTFAPTGWEQQEAN